MLFSRRRHAAHPAPPRPEEPPSGCVAINDTLFNRLMVICAISVLSPLCHHSSKVLFLPSGICVKYGDNVDLSEAAAVEFVRKHTSIPVPKIHCAFTHGTRTYIVMERIKGHMIAIGWDKRSEDSRACLLAQLKSMMDQMRNIPPTHGPKVAGVEGGSLYDMRLPGLGVIYPVPTPRRFGPFDDIPSFHRWLRRSAESADDRYPSKVNQLIEMHDSTDWGLPVFTHGDLSSLNVLVQGNTITGIIDWETAGWYPFYWEYTTAKHSNFRDHPEWPSNVDKFLQSRPRELEMERIRFEYFGI